MKDIVKVGVGVGAVAAFFFWQLVSRDLRFVAAAFAGTTLAAIAIIALGDWLIFGRRRRRS